MGDWGLSVHRSDHRPNGEPLQKPTARELRVLIAVADDVPLRVAADRVALPRTSVAAILSGLYLRLGITLLSNHPLSRDRRTAAVRMCLDHGWLVRSPAGELMRPGGDDPSGLEDDQALISGNGSQASPVSQYRGD